MRDDLFAPDDPLTYLRASATYKWIDGRDLEKSTPKWFPLSDLEPQSAGEDGVSLVVIAIRPLTSAGEKELGQALKETIPYTEVTVELVGYEKDGEDDLNDATAKLAQKGYVSGTEKAKTGVKTDWGEGA